MTLAHKIAMCLSLWSPDGLHVESQELLARWYNQQQAFVKNYDWTENLYLDKPFLSYYEFATMFSLPNSDLIKVAVCIQEPSEGV